MKTLQRYPELQYIRELFKDFKKFCIQRRQNENYFVYNFYIYFSLWNQPYSISNIAYLT